MDTLNDIIKYLYLNYPYKYELSKARVVKMIYLADWKYAMLYQRQLTNINWYFNHYGPYVSDVIDAIRDDNDFTIHTQTNMYGEPKELIKINEKYTYPNLSEDVKWLTKPLGEPDSKSGLEALQPGAMLAYLHG